jgi:hypothetical protein
MGRYLCCAPLIAEGPLNPTRVGGQEVQSGMPRVDPRRPLVSGPACPCHNAHPSASTCTLCVTPELRPSRNLYITTGRYICCAPLIAEGPLNPTRVGGQELQSGMPRVDPRLGNPGQPLESGPA